jgi:hypothetical protein
MKITYGKLFEVVDVLNALDLSVADKFKYAVDRNSPKLNKLLKAYNEKIFDINLEHCLTDVKDGVPGAVKKDEKGNFVFDKAGMKAREEGIRALKAEEVEVDLYICKGSSHIAKKIGPAAIEILSGAIFTKEDADAMINELLAAAVDVVEEAKTA